MSHPSVLLFDVNETLSDLAPMGDRFAEVGLPAHVAPTWFAGLLRDGFAVTVTGRQASFKEIGADVLRGLAAGVDDVDADAAIDHVLGAFMTLDLHPDVVDGLRQLQETRHPDGHADERRGSHPEIAPGTGRGG